MKEEKGTEGLPKSSSGSTCETKIPLYIEQQILYWRLKMTSNSFCRLDHLLMRDNSNTAYLKFSLLCDGWGRRSRDEHESCEKTQQYTGRCHTHVYSYSCSDPIRETPAILCWDWKSPLLVDSFPVVFTCLSRSVVLWPSWRLIDLLSLGILPHD